jgi:hypothetical protein
MKTVRTIIFILVLSCLIGCEQLQLNNYPLGNWTTPSLRDRTTKTRDLDSSNLAEVTSPQVIQELHQELKQYSPQVTITAPSGSKTFSQTDVEIKLAVEDLPIFQDDRLHLGNHVNLIVDNEPLQAIYSLEEPIIIKNLAPGTHSVRAFAVSPWGESFKNEGAYAQTTFNVLTQTNNNRPNTDLPLLTYNSPTGTYGAEPVLLDFYLNQPDGGTSFTPQNTDHSAWQVKATVNGTSFMIKNWQPYYLSGFKPGDNWIQLELIDPSGKTIENTFNNTVRVINYDPQQQDTLAKLVTNQISLNDAQGMVKQSYYIQPVETPEIVELEDTAKPKNPVDIGSNSTADELEATAKELSAANPKTTDQDNQLIESEVKQTTAKPEEKAEIAPPKSTTIAPNIQSNNQLKIKPNNSQAIISDQISEAKTEPTTDMALETGIASDANDSDLVKLPTKPSASDVAAKGDKLVADNLEQVKPKPTSSKIVITESNSPQKPIAEITIPPTESVKIEVESNIASDLNSDRAIANPVQQSPQVFAEPSTDKFLWWKKFLVGLRQAMESLARQLPSKV